MSKIYVIGSLRNPKVTAVADKLRKSGYEAFDDWMAAGPEADDFWRDYEKGRGHDFELALLGYAAKHVFEFDKHHLDTCDAALLVLPAGKSGHLELGYVRGQGKPVAILLDESPDRWDVMYQFAGCVSSELDDVVRYFNREIVSPLSFRATAKSGKWAPSEACAEWGSDGAHWRSA